MPSITKLVQELENLGLLEKYADREDKRVILLALTKEGKAHVKKHVEDFQRTWTERLGHVSDKQARDAIWVIEQLSDTMPGK